MMRLIRMIALLTAGAGLYVLVSRYLLPLWQQEKASQGASVRRGVEQAVESIGHVGGAALTGGGEGEIEHTVGSDGSRASERVGRGVVRRKKD